MQHTKTLIILTASGLVAASCLADEPFFIRLGFLPGGGAFGSVATDVSYDGRVVVGKSDSDRTRSEAFRWTNPANGGSGLVGLGYPDGTQASTSPSVSTDGYTLVVDQTGCSDQSCDPGTALWTDPAQGGIGWSAIELPPDWLNPRSHSISGDGFHVVGRAEGAEPDLTSSAFKWTLTDPASGDGIATLLSALPWATWSGANDISTDGSVIVGSCGDADGRREACYWEDGAITSLGVPNGYERSTADVVNADGSVIFGYVSREEWNPDGWWDWHHYPVRWTGAGAELLPRPAGEWGTVVIRGASADGSVMVGMANASPGPYDITAVLWHDDYGVVLLRDLLVDEFGFDLTGMPELYNARAVSGDGRTIVGYGHNDDGIFEGWVIHLGSPCDADFNGDGVVNTLDFIAYLNAYNVGDPRADMNGDGVVNTLDFIAFLNAYSEGC